MDLSTLVLSSSAVSLITLGLLLLRRRRPSEERIPSWFLGSTREAAERRLKLATPPWLAWALVALFTVGAALLFWPPTPERDARTARRSAAVWVDPTLSAHLSRIQNGFDPRQVAARIWSEGHALHGITTRSDAAHLFLPRYDLRTLESVGDVETFLREESRRVVPFARPLAEAPLLEALAAVPDFRDGAGAFFAVSDGQTETLQSLAFLGETFRAGRLFPTGLPRSFEGHRAEIVPRSLARAWGLEGDGAVNGGKAPLEAGDDLSFRPFDEGTGVIPLQARPGLAVESVDADDKGTALAFVTTLEADSKARPLLTACGTGVGGPQELDPISDLRALAAFFSLPLRREDCLEHGVERTRAAGLDPWAWRRQSLWIVPLSEEVAGTLGGKGEFWIPAGFEPCCDSLVYTAPLRPADASGVELARTTVQLEEGAAPVIVALAPHPPQDPLRYPAELIGGGDDTRPEAAANAPPSSDTFAPVLEAADGTPLAFKARRARAAYVRTTLAMPNGELGRSSVWSQMWLSLLSDAEGARGPSLDVRSPSSPADLARLPATLFARILAADELAFRDVREGDPGLGLFAPAAGGMGGAMVAADAEPEAGSGPRTRLTLVAPSPLERVQAVMDPEEFEALWNRGAARAVSSEGDDARPRGVRPQALTGAVLAAISLAGLWFLPRLLSRSRARSLLLALPWFLWLDAHPISLLLPSRAEAQPPGAGDAQGGALRRFFFGSRPHSESLPPGTPTTVPFRVAWCDAMVPAEVAARYLTLRDLLASRGTIEMPKELVAGGCRPGAAEVWWASDPASFDRAALVEHVTLGGGFVLEGLQGDALPEALVGLETPAIGLRWERGQRRGLLYRSFYLLASFDGCPQENTWLLSLRKRAGAHSPVALATRTRFLTQGGDCFGGDDDLRGRSFVNLMYAFLTTDYKEDQLQLPEILSRVRNLGLEP